MDARDTTGASLAGIMKFLGLKPDAHVVEQKRVIRTPSTAPEVREVLTARSPAQICQVALAGLVAYTVLAVAVHDAVDPARLVAWFGANAACIACGGIVSLRAARSGAPGSVRPGNVHAWLIHAAEGLLAAFLPVLVPAPADRPDVVLVYLLFMMGVATVNLLVAGPEMWLFIGFQALLLGASTLVLLIGIPGVPRILAVLYAVLFAVLVSTRLEQLRLIARTAESRRRAEHLARDLAAERDRTVEANRRLAAANEALAHQAGHDPLTGLANRSSFLESLTAALARGRREGHHVAVLFIDIDRFKLVNDSLGHAAGDALLVIAAERIRRITRPGDRVTRHGGDEFTVLMSRVEAVSDAVIAAERIREVMAQPIMTAGQRIETTVSIGLALDVSDVEEPADLLRHADAALYRAKDRGRNRIEVCDDGLRNSLRSRISDEAELREALAAGRIVPWYQPVVDMRTGTIVGAEALARWIHPDRGVMLPDEFVPLALEAGLSTVLGRRIVHPAMAFRRQIDPLVRPGFQISVNLAARANTLSEIVESIGREAHEHGQPPDSISLEITERAVITDLENARAALERARSMSFAVALDDFGTGYSSLSLIRDLPLDIIKIDRSFVRGLGRNEADTAVITAVLQLAKKLSLRVIAEGVEFMDDVERLSEAGARLAQGFRYSPAVPPEEFELWLRERPPWLDGERGTSVPLPRSGRAARTTWPRAWQAEAPDADREDRRDREDRVTP